MTDTPRTDEQIQYGALDDHAVVDAEFARQLEREAEQNYKNFCAALRKYETAEAELARYLANKPYFEQWLALGMPNTNGGILEPHP